MAKTDFYKGYGAEGRNDTLLSIADDRYLLIYGYGSDGDDLGYNWRRYYDHRPTADELRRDINDLVNSLTDERILTGYVWRGNKVWLSTENQMNFKAAYDLAVQTQGATLPVTFKLGENEDGTPHYHTFSSVDEFTDFYTRAMAYVIGCINEGWEEKDNIDWSVYEP